MLFLALLAGYARFLVTPAANSLLQYLMTPLELNMRGLSGKKKSKKLRESAPLLTRLPRGDTEDDREKGLSTGFLCNRTSPPNEEKPLEVLTNIRSSGSASEISLKTAQD